MNEPTRNERPPTNTSRSSAAVVMGTTADTRVLRGLSAMLRLHGLCGRRACRRAHACRGEPRECLMRYAPLVPEDAREGAKAMIAAQSRGQDFDELLDDARADVMALAAWAGAVEASYRRRRA